MTDKNNLPVFSVLPKHVGFIMDGNGRWAKNRGLPRSVGHKAGAKTFRKIGEYAADLGIEVVTFYAFSTENWKRPEAEVNAIMELFGDYLNEVIDRIRENEEKGIRLKFIGDRSGISPELLNLMDYTEKLTAIIRDNNIKSVTIVRMEVPCCGGLENAAKRALQSSGKFLPWSVVTISTDGKILE